MVDTKLLKRTIAWRDLTQVELAKRIGIAPETLSNKINNKVGFTNKETMIIAKALELDNNDIVAIFMN